MFIRHYNFEIDFDYKALITFIVLFQVLFIKEHVHFLIVISGLLELLISGLIKKSSSFELDFC